MKPSGTTGGLAARAGKLLLPPALLALLQLGAFLASIYLAFLLRFEFALPPAFDPLLILALVMWPPLKLLVFRLAGLQHGWWRQVSLSDVLRVVRANVLASVVVTLATLLFAGRAFPRSLYPLDFLISVALTCGLRVLRRAFWDLHLAGRATSGRMRALVYGAGDAGMALVHELRHNPDLPYEPVGYIDDDRRLRHFTALGLKVLGTGDELHEVVQRHEVQVVLIAIPSLRGPGMVRILGRCREAGVAFKTVPTLGQVLENVALARQIRDVAADDLLTRAPVDLDIDAIHNRIEGRTVLVTGAAGSIGSELCRQLARYHPAAIVGFDCAESALFTIDGEMRERFAHVSFRPELGSIANRARLAEIFARHRPAVVMHAAAYKHVPLLEDHVLEAIENNVFGTENVAQAAVAAGATDFVLVSSDKAVHPANVMGATKRIAELMLGARHGGDTKFVAVRFGNVLGSNGSVVPIFMRQIRSGGPVTVTHPEARRFFMTIPEAAQLVIQAAAMGRGGEIFVLEMGESVRIIDLARNLILLCGLRPDEDIAIEFTGLRPGERLAENVSRYNEATLPTTHEKIRIFAGVRHDAREIEDSLAGLRQACLERNSGAAIAGLKELVADFNPEPHLPAAPPLRKPARARAASAQD